MSAHTGARTPRGCRKSRLAPIGSLCSWCGGSDSRPSCPFARSREPARRRDLRRRLGCRGLGQRFGRRLRKRRRTGPRASAVNLRRLPSEVLSERALCPSSGHKSKKARQIKAPSPSRSDGEGRGGVDRRCSARERRAEPGRYAARSIEVGKVGTESSKCHADRPLPYPSPPAVERGLRVGQWCSNWRGGLLASNSERRVTNLQALCPPPDTSDDSGLKLAVVAPVPARTKGSRSEIPDGTNVEPGAGKRYGDTSRAGRDSRRRI
jgi:hypothetical protein